MDNFAHLAQSFLETDSARVLRNDTDLAKIFLFEDEQELLLLGRRAKETLDALSGATEKTLSLIEDYMGKV
jgi:hypothetical protein